MSLDVSLYRKYSINSNILKAKEEELYWANITHNLREMASKAGVYEVLWRPEEFEAKYAKDIVEILEIGLMELKSRPQYFEQFNSPNGWGLYENFVSFVEEYLKVCIEYPQAEIYVSR